MKLSLFFLFLAFWGPFLLQPSLTQAESAKNCRNFVETVLRSQNLSPLAKLRRGNWAVSDGGADPDRPFILIKSTKKSANPLPQIETFEEGHHGWTLDISVPPMKHYIYRFHVHQHECELRSVQVNGLVHHYSSKDCEEALHSTTPELRYVRDACSIGHASFAVKSVSTDRGATSTSPDAAAKGAGGARE